MATIAALEWAASLPPRENHRVAALDARAAHRPSRLAATRDEEDDPQRDLHLSALPGHWAGSRNRESAPLVLKMQGGHLFRADADAPGVRRSRSTWPRSTRSPPRRFTSSRSLGRATDRSWRSRAGGASASSAGGNQGKFRRRLVALRHLKTYCQSFLSVSSPSLVPLSQMRLPSKNQPRQALLAILRDHAIGGGNPDGFGSRPEYPKPIHGVNGDSGSPRCPGAQASPAPRKQVDQPAGTQTAA